MKRSLIDRWRSGVVRGFGINEVIAELERHGFALERTRSGHWKARHRALRGCPDFPVGLVVISAHAFGRSGEVHPEAIRDILRAIEWIEEQQ